jgi:hypothetical protein
MLRKTVVSKMNRVGVEFRLSNDKLHDLHSSYNTVGCYDGLDM